MKPLFLLLTFGLALQTWAGDARPNVLLMVSDDLAATLGCYGHPQAQTPHLDALAKEGVLFSRAYCQFPHCNPSRSSFLSGLRPNQTRVTDNADSLYVNIPDVLTLPHHFRQQGYATARCGKLFHLGIPTGLESMDDPHAWDFGTPFKDERPYPPKRNSIVTVQTGKKQGLVWQEIPGDDDQLCDGAFATTAIGWLKKRDADKPFFLAVGFHRPHLPLVAPAKYFDLYPLDEITLPDSPANDVEDIPAPARNGSVPGYAMTSTPEQRRASIRAYLACVSYVDAQAGRLLASLKEQGLLENTIIIFTSDHGWHLGEHGLWHKRSLFEESARVPLIVSAPGMKGNGRTAVGLAELTDLYPTLCDLCGISAPSHLQGKSLRPVLNDPASSVHVAAFTQARRGKDAEHWGRSVRTPRWRCTEWDEGRNGIELYDHEADPHEYTNLAQVPEHAPTLKELRAMLAKHLPQMVLSEKR
ncbi:sulfatase [Prosthecobacter dejongeii]|uniref:Putative sulfatase n=1 Tax=Prosthecobacter dejongeii TaxID=48465 RepID=A0A7W7YNE2_9BACT|nr:sulfatase [Prosthecobacter dejongeii]MBB5039135.1 putative sulfatase [Prosthecobacter dejongeii]